MTSRAFAMALIAALATAAPAPAASVSAIPVTAGGPHGVAADADGVLVGARDCGYIGRVDASDVISTLVPQGPLFPCTPDNAGSGRAVFNLLAGTDGRIYFTRYDSDPANDGFGHLARVNRDGS